MTILWEAQHETGTYDEWDIGGYGGHQDSGPGTAVSVVDNTRAHTGSWSLKMSTDTTAGGAGARNFRWAIDYAGTPLPLTARFEGWYYITQNYSPTTFWSLMQWKTRTDDVGGSFVDHSIMAWLDGANGMRLWDYDQHIAADRLQYSAPNAFAPGSWHHLVVDYFWHETAGSIVSTLDGVQWLSLSGIATMWATTSTNPRYRSWSINNYTDNMTPAASDIWVDDARISDTNVVPFASRRGSARRS